MTLVQVLERERRGVGLPAKGVIMVGGAHGAERGRRVGQARIVEGCTQSNHVIGGGV